MTRGEMVVSALVGLYGGFVFSIGMTSEVVCIGNVSFSHLYP